MEIIWLKKFKKIEPTTNDDDDDDDDDELFLWHGWPTKGLYMCLALFPAGTIVRDPHHRKSLTCHKHDLNLCRTWVQA